MDRNSFDAFTQLLAKPRSRRRVVRLLTGVALGGALGLRGLAKVDAGPRQKPACRPGKRVATVRVPGDGTTVQTPVLERRQRYLLRASGYVKNYDNVGQGLGIDAEYAFLAGGSPDPRDTRGGVDYGVSIDGAAPDWGAYSSAHIYEREVTGRGRALSLRLLDDYYPDNNGGLTVKIYCA